MAAATQARNTSAYAGYGVAPLVKAGVTIYAGTLVAVDETGHAVPAAKETGLVAAGRAEGNVDNSKGADGDNYVKVLRGVFKWDNSATNPVTIAHCLRPCYIEDDCTVSCDDIGSSVAGTVLGIDTDGQVIVETR